MELKADLENTYYNSSMLPKHFFEINYDVAKFVLNHSHPLLDEIQKSLFCQYRVVMKFTQSPHALDDIIVNNRGICFRLKKVGEVHFGKGVKLLQGTPTSVGGSNSYPYPCFKEKFCILEFVSNGIPCIESNGWITELLTLEKI